MRVGETISELVAFSGRGPGTDAERRAALWLAGQLRSAGRTARIETFWCRPNWALGQAWHLALAIAGSLLSVHTPRLGLALLVAALACLAADAVFGVSPGRRLTPERASQNVVSEETTITSPPARLLITSHYDAGRTALLHTAALRRLAGPLDRLTRGALPGILAWLAAVILWLIVIAALRLHGEHTRLIGVLQLIPSVLLILGFALLLEAGLAGVGPAANDCASGTAMAVALARVLNVTHPANLAVDVVLAGAHEGGAIGLRRYLRDRRRSLRPAGTVRLELGPCGSGSPAAWASGDRARPPGLRELCRELSRLHPDLVGSPREAWAAGTAGGPPGLRLPSLHLAALSPRGAFAHSHEPGDTPAHIEEATLERVLQLALLVVDALDTRTEAASAAAPAPPAATPA